MQYKFAPKEIFEQILSWMVIPTFDLIIEYNDQGIIIVKRKIAPYKNKRALPWLRIYKWENIDDVIERIVLQELGLTINVKTKTYIGQYIWKFKTEQNRQDISTAYHIKINTSQKIIINKWHFFSIKFVQCSKDIPKDIWGMYKFYLNEYFSNNNRKISNLE
jgi:ADP-ribose pyrophosphatase YjhB (NUDIX family)